MAHSSVVTNDDVSFDRREETYSPAYPKTQAKADSHAETKKPNAILRLLSFAGPRKPLAFVGCVLSGINGILSVLPLVFVWFVVRDLIAVAPHWDQAADVALWAWLAFGTAVLGCVIYFAALMSTHLAAFRIAANMRKKCIDHLAKVPLGYYDSHASGHIRRVIDGCAGQTEDVIAHKLPDFFGSLMAPVAFLVVMFIFDWALGLLCLVPVAVSFFAMWWMMGRDVPQGGRYFMQRYQEALARMSTAATEYVRGIPVVKVFQQTVQSFRAFHAAIVDYKEMATNYVEFCRVPQVVQLVAINSTFAVLIPAGIIMAATAPDFATFFANYLFYVIFSALTTTMMNKVMYSSEAVMMAEDALRRIDEILETPVLPEAAPDQVQHAKNASIAFQNVSFAYPGTDVLAVDRVSLEIPEGSTIAIVGPSGGGKTTLASLIPRFWDVASGGITVGGADVRRIPTRELMEQVAFVFQNDHLFKRSLAENIRAGRPDATDEEVAQAAHQARCDDIIAKMPQGLNTVVGTDGTYLSGGECQRIVLARAILKNAPIVVLDEATAFADPENEALIQEALSTLCEGKTVVMIAHRLSTVVNANTIVVLANGRIVEQGTHAELLAARGTYADLWNDYQKSVEWKIERIAAKEGAEDSAENGKPGESHVA